MLRVNFIDISREAEWKDFYVDNIFFQPHAVASLTVEEEDGARGLTERLWSILWCYAIETIVKYLPSYHKMNIDRCI